MMIPTDPVLAIIALEKIKNELLNFELDLCGNIDFQYIIKEVKIASFFFIWNIRVMSENRKIKICFILCIIKQG